MTDQAPPRALFPTTIVAIIAIVALAGLLLPVYSAAIDPTVTISAETISIRAFPYGTTLARADITSVSLEDTLPLPRRSAGLSGTTMRGSYRIDGLGLGRVYARRQSGYVVIRTRESFVVVNFVDRSKTQELYRELQLLGLPRR